MSDEKREKSDKEKFSKSESGKDPSRKIEDIQPSVEKPVNTTVSSESKDKKAKTLRFDLSKNEASIPRSGSIGSLFKPYQEELPNVGFRSSPLPPMQSTTVRDVMRAWKADVEDDGSGSSSYSDAIQPTAFAYKPIFDAFRKSPTKSQADYDLLIAAYLRNFEGVAEALDNGANVNVAQDKQTPLIIATENNDKPLVKYLLSVENIDLNRQDIYGNTALLIALKQGYDEIATWLIQKGCRLDIVNGLGISALHEALWRENYGLVKLLLSHYHELEIKDRFGEKPIFVCTIKKPNSKLLSTLLNAGASCEYHNETGFSLLSRAVLYSKNVRVIRQLISAGADVNHQDKFCKRTPLHMAAIVDNIAIARVLMENGADPDLKTISGHTAFDLALYYRCFETAEYLAIYTNEASLSLGNFKETLLGRVPNNKSATFLLKANAGLSSTLKIKPTDY